MNQTGFEKEMAFPPLPLSQWKPTKNTLHLYLQIVGKIRLALFPPMNHWWNVALYVSTRGLTTRPIPCFDLALTRFSGKPAPVRENAGTVEREAYSQEVISFGFWAGDDNIPAPAFYSYTAPEPKGLTEEKLQPEAAFWGESNGSHLALLMYDEARKAKSPRETILQFLESAYQAGTKRADWDTKKFVLKPL
ncbi:MAG: DUF5996 family protein [Acidobacteria bacterium]|nr:DUF5996 family protein [Acidobacteriota bacterium]